MKRVNLLQGLAMVLFLTGCSDMGADVEGGDVLVSFTASGSGAAAIPAEIPGIAHPITVDGLELIFTGASRMEQYTDVYDREPQSPGKIFLVVKAELAVQQLMSQQMVGLVVSLNDGVPWVNVYSQKRKDGYQVTWLFEVDRAETSYMIHLAGGLDIPLDSLVYPPAPTRMPPTATRPTTTPTRTPLPTEPPETAVAAAAGREHTCAVTQRGGVKCWGSNDHGQLGDGTLNESNVPVDVAGLTDAVAVTAGWKHTCALTAAGGVKCWGYNKNGELGNGKTEDSPVPVPVSGLTSGVTMIDAGDDHTCAVGDQGIVRCWGYNEFGQLGDGTRTSRSIPVFASATAGGATAVAAGWGHSCAVTKNDSAVCWGNDELGQLGDVPQEADYRLTAVTVAEVERAVVKLAADGGQSCVLTIYGGIRCWGYNKYGQLGDGTSETRNIPVRVEGLTPDQRELAVGWNHTCAVDGKGGLRCWGWNLNGQLGDGTKTSRARPAGAVDLPEGVKAAGLGFAHSCAVMESGAVYCWGSNEHGQLGDGSGTDSPAPVAAAGFAGTPAAPAAAAASNATAAIVTATPAPPTAMKIATPTKTATFAPPTPAKTRPNPTRTPSAGGIPGITQPITVDGVKLKIVRAYTSGKPDTYGRIDLFVKAKVLTEDVKLGQVIWWDVTVNGVHLYEQCSIMSLDDGVDNLLWYFIVSVNETTYVLNLPGEQNIPLDSLL